MGKLPPSQAKENRHDKKRLKNLHYERRGNGFNVRLVVKGGKVRFFNTSLIGRRQTTARNFLVTLEEELTLEEIMACLHKGFEGLIK